ncbi:hypothetical protein AJ79_07442 [Helicocarpus griseus UAMH5409]|uniref:Uncharacterized protein n=1 Tax=Helicocarpus griseus UAMH5409 TaxID=1447875 RepID=A0A2B7X2G3_9EURO|nr:hypothetical protein AJ79_07442 [Helicocarpus griseus UAMH5409]
MANEDAIQAAIDELNSQLIPNYTQTAKNMGSIELSFRGGFKAFRAPELMLPLQPSENSLILKKNNFFIILID